MKVLLEGTEHDIRDKWGHTRTLTNHEALAC